MYPFFKRLSDFILAINSLLIFFPLLLIVLFFVWKEDKHQPFFIAKRVGRKGKLFNMFKIRTMIYNSNIYKINSTSKDDKRITKLGKLLRRYKIDEIPQLINIFKGEMSFVGPRPNTYESGVELYTVRELSLLNLKPGITDIASIVFSDEAEILYKYNLKEETADETYNRLIRPWKSELGLWYIKNSNFLLDLLLIFLTISSIFNRKRSLNLLSNCLSFFKAPPTIIEFSKRELPLDNYFG